MDKKLKINSTANINVAPGIYIQTDKIFGPYSPSIDKHWIINFWMEHIKEEKEIDVFYLDGAGGRHSVALIDSD